MAADKVAVGQGGWGRSGERGGDVDTRAGCTVAPGAQWRRVHSGAGCTVAPGAQWRRILKLPSENYDRII